MLTCRVLLIRVSFVTSQDCRSVDSSTGIYVVPGNGPKPADLGGAASITSSLVVVALAAIMAVVGMKL
jgi:hypothetical protein